MTIELDARGSTILPLPEAPRLVWEPMSLYSRKGMFHARQFNSAEVNAEVQSLLAATKQLQETMTAVMGRLNNLR